VIPFAAPPNAGGGALKLKSTSILYGIMSSALSAVSDSDLAKVGRNAKTRYVHFREAPVSGTYRV